MLGTYWRPVDEEDFIFFFFQRTSVPSSLTVQALTDSLLFGHCSQADGEVGAAFLCLSRNNMIPSTIQSNWKQGRRFWC